MTTLKIAQGPDLPPELDPGEMDTDMHAQAVPQAERAGYLAHEFGGLSLLLAA